MTAAQTLIDLTLAYNAADDELKSARRYMSQCQDAHMQTIIGRESDQNRDAANNELTRARDAVDAAGKKQYAAWAAWRAW